MGGSGKVKKINRRHAYDVNDMIGIKVIKMENKIFTQDQEDLTEEINYKLFTEKKQKEFLKKVFGDWEK